MIISVSVKSQWYSEYDVGLLWDGIPHNNLLKFVTTNDFLIVFILRTSVFND